MALTRRGDNHRALPPPQAGRPPINDMIPRDLLFTYQGGTGWNQRRDLGAYKGSRSEASFADQHSRFTSEATEPPPEEVEE